MKILKHFLVVFLVEALLLGALFIWMPKQKNSNILASESKGENTIVLTKSNEETVTITAKNKETTKERDFTIFDEKKLSADIEWKNPYANPVISPNLGIKIIDKIIPPIASIANTIKIIFLVKLTIPDKSI